MPAQPPVLSDAPAALDAGHGRPVAAGRYRGAIGDLSTRAWDGDCGWRSPRRLQRKGWLYCSACTPRYSVGYAIVDAGLVATAFVYVFDRQTGRLHEDKATVPFGFAADFAPDWRKPWQLASGDRRWSIEPAGAAGWQIRFAGRQLTLSLDIDRGGDGLTAISIAPGRPFAHTWKLCALRSTLRFTLDGVAVETAASSAIDFTLGYPPRSSLWNWASLDGQTDDGRKFGLNLVAHYMNGLENALWLDGELIPLPQAIFDYDAAQPLATWRIASVDGRVDVSFHPQGARRERLDAWLLRSDFIQPFGHFTGHVAGRQVSGYGVVEQHAAYW